MASQSAAFPRTALITYGSETGTAQDAAEEISILTRRLRFTTRVSELDSVALNDLVRADVVVIAISTTGQGDLPANAQSFWTKLRSAKLQPGVLSRAKFTSFGVGDSSYPNFNWAQRKLSTRLIQLGAQCIFDRGESDEQHPEGVDGLFIPWITKLRERLLEVYPLPSDVQPIPEDGFLEPDWELTLATSPINGHAVNDSEANEQPSLRESNIGEDDKHTMPTAMASPPFSKIPATLISNSRLTPHSHFQDVRLFEFSTPPVTYSPGDVLTIHPHNALEDVSELIQLMDWAEAADLPVHLTPTHLTTATQPTTPTTLRHILLTQTDLNAIPRRTFFTTLSHFTSDPSQRDRLLEFTNPALLDELYDYTTRPRRRIVEVLQEFHTVRLPWKWVLAIFPPIRGRQFSIASGGALKHGPEGDTRIQLVVAIVEYRTIIRRIRRGLCTRYLVSLPLGAEIKVSLNKSGMRVELDKPALLIGPGTGVAPLRSMIHERHSRSSTSSPHSDTGDGVAKKPWILFFGNRNIASDFFFAHEWPFFSERGELRVYTAFSRDQPRSIYVQDTFGSHAREIYHLLEGGGKVYVCGSSGRMPSAVRAALVTVIKDVGGVRMEQAEGYVRGLERSGRYQQETW